MMYSYLEKGLENFGAKTETQKTLESLSNWSSHWLPHSYRMFSSARFDLVENIETFHDKQTNKHAQLLCKSWIDYGYNHL